METIKCKKCGTEMSAMSEACPVCGQPTANEPSQPVPMPDETLRFEEAYVKSVDDVPTQPSSAPKTEKHFPFEDAYVKVVRDAFTENVKLQRKQPRKRWQITIQGECEDFCEALQWYFFDYPGRTITNRVNLGMGFVFDDTQFDKVKTLPIFTEMKLDETAIGDHPYFIECGADAEKAANIMLTMLSEVFKPSILPQFVNTEFGEKFPKGYMDSYDPMMFCIDLSEGRHLIPIRKQVEIVNRKAERYGHAPIEYVENPPCVKGYYAPADLESGNFLSKSKKAFQNGDIQGEITKLINMCFDALK